MPEVVLQGVTVRRGGRVVLRDVSFAAASGELTMLMGESGSGKSSALRAIAGLDPIERGAVCFDDRNMADVPTGERDTVLTFQADAAVLSARSVERNIGFPLEVRRETTDLIRERVGVEAQTLHIEHLLLRDVAHLSVGEAQMVQLARALVRVPSVLLLDEPFAPLEGERGGILRRELRYLQREFGVTTLMTSNDPTDARRLADRLVVLERGNVVQTGSFTDVFERPATASAAFLTGDAAIDTVRVETDGPGAWLVHPAFRVRAWAEAVRRHGGRRMQLVTRPEWWSLDPHGQIEGTVTRVIPWGGTTTLTVDIAGRPTIVRDGPVAEGDRVKLRLTRWQLLDPLDGRSVV